jgi:putative nucleotidyltransferase with HDIG domain
MQKRIREFEVIESVTRALREATSSEAIAERLVLETARLMRSQHAAVLLLDGDALHMKAAHGLFESPALAIVPRGRGLSWAALESRDVIYSVDALADTRSFDPEPDNAPSHAQLTAPILGAQGEPIGVLISARNHPETFDSFESRMIAVITDAAANALERVKVAERLWVQAQESRTLLDLSRMLERTDAPAIQAALERVRELAGADVAVITRLESGVFKVYAQTGHPTPELNAAMARGIAFESVRHLNLPTDQGFEVLAVSDHPLAAPQRQLGVHATYTVVIQREGQTMTVVMHRLKTQSGWSASEHGLLDGAARILGAVIERVDRVRVLEASYEGALRAIGVALEVRDREAAGHTDRVSALSEQLAHLVGMNESEAKAVRWGAYLHDMGKLSVPDAILLKTGPLNQDEMKLARSHVVYGHDLALNLSFLPTSARNVIRHHHERWDGSGYPDGLKGESIPLEARIFAVCDVFDTLLFARPYKPAMSYADARAELREAGRTGQLEPRMVWAFEQLLDKPDLV